MQVVLNDNALHPEAGMVDALHAGIGKHLVVPLYLLPQSVGYPSYAQLRIYELVRESRYILACKFKKGVFDGLGKRQTLYSLCDPFRTYTAAIDAPDLLAVPLE